MLPLAQPTWFKQLEAQESVQSLLVNMAFITWIFWSCLLHITYSEASYYLI